MWLQNFLHAVPVIDFDPTSGTWQPVGSDLISDDTALVDIADKLFGDYLDCSDEMHGRYGKGDAGTKIFFTYWSPDRSRFYFQDSDGKRIEIDGKRSAEVIEAKDPAGHSIDSYMQFSIYEPDGQLIYRHIYDQTPYMTAYHMDFSFPPAELSSWDYFVALQGSFDYMRENAHKHHGTGARTDASTERVAAEKLCPRSGWWFTPAETNSRRYFKQGETFPAFDDSDYGTTFWQWSPDQSDPSLR